MLVGQGSHAGHALYHEILLPGCHSLIDWILLGLLRAWHRPIGQGFVHVQQLHPSLEQGQPFALWMAKASANRGCLAQEKIALLPSSIGLA